MQDNVDAGGDCARHCCTQRVALDTAGPVAAHQTCLHCNALPADDTTAGGRHWRTQPVAVELANPGAAAARNARAHFAPTLAVAVDGEASRCRPQLAAEETAAPVTVAGATHTYPQISAKGAGGAGGVRDSPSRCVGVESAPLAAAAVLECAQ